MIFDLTKKRLVMTLILLPLLGVAAFGQNLVGNGDFEAGYNNGWNHLADNGSSASFSQETGDPYEGANALKVQINSLGGNSWDVQTLGPSVSLSVGEEYTLSFWGKSTSGSTSVRMVLQNGSWLSNDHNLGTDWTEYTWTFTATEASPQLKMHYFETGTIWLDDIQLVPFVGTTNPVEITVSPEMRHQTMVGFGGALSWYSSRVYNGSAANAAAINQLMFEDLGLDIVRIKNWYYPNNYPNNTDPVAMSSQAYFDASKDFYDAAKAANSDIQVLLSSWSPPAYLKSNGDRENGGTLKSDVNGYMYDELGQYWADALDNLGWAPDYLSFQNEPEYSAVWESCVLRPTETTQHAGYAESADAIWDSIKDRPDVPLMVGSEAGNIGDHTWSDWNGGNPVNTFEALNTPILSRSYFAVHGYHIYNIWDESQIDNINGELNMVRDSFGDRPNWMTEFSLDDFDWLEAARVIHNTVVEADTAAYIYWKLVWDYGSPDTMIGVNSSGSYEVNDHYYMLKHYAKHVDIGYERIEVSGSNNGLKVSGFISPDGTNITLVAINKSAYLQPLDLIHNALPIDTVVGYQSVTNNFYQTLSSVDVSLPIDLPPESITTFVLSLSNSVNVVNPELVYLYDPLVSGGGFTAKVPDQPGIIFSLWKTDDLAEDPWTEVTSATQDVMDGAITFTDTNSVAPARFYRVEAAGN